MRQIYFVFSDTHGGSKDGLTAPGTQITKKAANDKETLEYSGFPDDVKWLWDNWLESIELLKLFAGGDPVYVKFAGDATHGTDHTDNTHTVIGAEQAKIAEAAMYPIWANVKNIIGWDLAYGTHAHDYGQSSGTRELASLINQWGMPVEVKPYTVGESTIDGWTVNMAHHGPTIGNDANRGTQVRTYARNMVAGPDGRIARKDKIPNCIIRGHGHRYYYEPVQIPWSDTQHTAHTIICASMCAPNAYVFQVGRTPDIWKAGPVMYEVIDGKMGEYVPMVKTRTTVYHIGGTIAHPYQGSPRK